MTTTISVQTTADTGLNYTTASAATTMQFTNDGRTTLFFVNSNASARTLTITKQQTAPQVQGFNPITLSNTTVTIPGSGTNGGICCVGPFAQLEYNDSTGNVQIAIDAVTGLTVAAISKPRL
jgi:hypothetical protein